MQVTALPPSIQRFLADFVARRRRALALRAIALAASGSLAWVLMLCVIDRLVPLPRPIRALALLCATVAALTILARPLLRLLTGSFEPVASAEALERFNPVLEQRLITVVSQANAAQGVRGSPALLIHLTEQLAGELPRRAVVSEPGMLLRPWLIAATLLLMMGLLAAIPSVGLPRLMQRIFKPWLPLGAVTTTQLVLTPGSVDVVEGRALVVSVTALHLKGGPPTIHFSEDNGRAWAVVPMMPTLSGPFIHRISSVDRDLIYNISGGDAVSPTHSIRVLRIPAVEQFQLQYSYPAHTRLPPALVTNTTGAIEAPVDSKVTLNIRTTEPLRGATLTLGRSKQHLSPTDNPAVWTTRLTVLRDEQLSLRLTGTNGVGSDGPATMLLRAVPDRAPIARLIGPNDGTRLGERDDIPIQFELVDDYGAARAAVVVQRNADPPTTMPIQLRGERPLHRRIVAINRAATGALPGDVLSISIEVHDANGQLGRSGARRVLVCDGVIDTAARRRLDAMMSALGGIDALLYHIRAAGADLLESNLAPMNRHVRDIQSNARRHFAAATEAASAVRLDLLRSLAHSASPQWAHVLAKLLDSVESTAAAIELLSAQIFPNRTSDMRESVSRRTAEMMPAILRVHDDLRVLCDAEQARICLSDRPLAAASAARPDTGSADAWRSALKEIDAVLKRMAVDPLALDFEARARAIVSAGDALVASGRPLDLVNASSEWARSLKPPRDPPMPAFDRRLLIAAQVEAVRPQGDAVWAHDLLLASEAARRLSNPDSVNPSTSDQNFETAFATAIAAMRVEHELRSNATTTSRPVDPVAAQAREQMRRWGGEEDVPAVDDSVEAPRALHLALWANALMAQHRYAEAHLVDEARRRIPRSAAMQGDSAGDDPSATTTLSQNAAARQRLASVPGLARIFAVYPAPDDFSIDESARFPSLGMRGEELRPRGSTTGPLDTMGSDSGPAGFEDSLKIYFQVLANQASHSAQGKQ